MTIECPVCENPFPVTRGQRTYMCIVSSQKFLHEVSCDSDTGPLSSSFLNLTRGGENTLVVIRLLVDGKTAREAVQEKMRRTCGNHVFIISPLAWPSGPSFPARKTTL